MAEELLVDQVLYSHLSKLFKGLLPLLSDSSWILARHKSVKGTLVHQQFVHAVDLEICRIKLVQSGGELDAISGASNPLRSVKTTLTP